MPTNSGYAPTPKAMEILQSVCEYGGLTPLQCSILLGKSLKYDADGRLIADRYYADIMKQFRENEYLSIVERDYHMRDGRKASVHKLTPKGKRALAKLGGGNRKLSDLGCATVPDSLEHFVLINDFRVTLMRAVADATNNAHTLETFDEPTLKSRHSKDTMTINLLPSARFPQGRIEHNVIIVPDFYFHLQVGQFGHYRRFVEIDRGTEIGKSSSEYDDWAKKVAKYREYTKKVGSLCEGRYGKNAVVILTVTTSEARMKNLKEVTEEAGGRRRFWFTTYDRLSPANFFNEPIWAIAGRDGLHEFTRTLKEEPAL